MPVDIKTYIPEFPIAISADQVQQVTIRVGPHGDGVVDVPTSSGIVEISKVPCCALSIMATLKTHGKWFVIYVSSRSSSPDFAVLVV